MKRCLFVLIAFTVACGALHREAPTEVQPGDAVSLRRLQEEHADLRRLGREVPETLTRLGGITRINTVVFHDDDVILAGERDMTLPPLELDFLVVALRNSFGSPGYGAEQLGVTIDPRPGEGIDPWKVHDVRVFGEPFVPLNGRPMAATSALGALFVRADYQLKAVGAGYEELPGVTNRFAAASASAACGEASSRDASRHRYWYRAEYPESPRFVADGHAIVIQKPIKVRLDTEEEFHDRRGERLGRGEARPAATDFAREVTALLDTDDSRLMSQMRQAFRTIEVAALIRRADRREAIRYLLDDYLVAAYEVPAEVEGVTRDQTTSVTCGGSRQVDASGTSTVTRSVQLTRKYRGGVYAGVDLTDRQFAGARSDQLAMLRTRIIESRPASDTLAWRVVY